MTEKGMENNKVTVIGTIVSGFTFSHAVFGEGFYLVDLLVNRLSEQADIIPLMISERLIDVTKDYQGCTMEASGQFRSYNRHEGTQAPYHSPSRQRQGSFLLLLVLSGKSLAALPTFSRF